MTVARHKAGSLGVVAAVAWSAVGSTVAEDARLVPLPVWSPEEQAILQAHPDTPLLLGGLLWPRGADGGLNVDPNLPISSEEQTLPGNGTPPVLADSPDLAQPVADLTGFLPPSQISASNNPESLAAKKPTPANALRSTSAEFANDCYENHPEQFVIDPAYHLTELEREDLERFLAYHAGDAKIKASVLVMAADEVLAKGFDFSRVSQGGLLKENTCLLVLPVGEPWRARLFFTSNIHQAARAADLADILAGVMAKGEKTLSHGEQLHQMLVELSIRLFWLEKQLAPEPAVPSAPPVVLGVHPKTVSSPAPVAFAEVFSDEPRVVVMMKKVIHHPWASWMLFAACTLLGAAIWIRWQRYRLRHYEWILPEPAVITPRLGGAYAGGGGAMIAYR